MPRYHFSRGHMYEIQFQDTGVRNSHTFEAAGAFVEEEEDGRLVFDLTGGHLRVERDQLVDKRRTQEPHPVRLLT